MPHEPTTEQVAIPTADGLMLAARVFRPQAEPRGAALILCCVGGTQARYEALARFLTQRHWIVVTFDYRGVGSSRALESTRANTMVHWGTHDFDAVISWTRSHLHPKRLVAVGHSIGGQLIPFANGARHLDAAVCVAAQRGYWRHWRGIRRLALLTLWHVYIPVCVRALGQVPLPSGRESLDPQVAVDWARWGLSNDYRTHAGESLKSKFSELNIPMLFLSFGDDTLFAPKAAVDALARDYFVSACRVRCHVEPREHGLPTIGHSGFFDPGCCPRSWWDDLSNWMANVKACTNSPCEVFECRPSPSRLI